ncbi:MULTISPECIES: hypothetical protein [unclassified Nocardia]|uniref:hypothetical protein n=1 Tax=unclassified Nocardia TaxID=2637762 RepID=UPI00278C8846|nr:MULTISPECIES: hypothetical protein [unclassified Nocardia]
MTKVTPVEIARGWRELTPDQEADAQLLIDAAYGWITHPDRRPNLDYDDPMGMRAVVEVVRAALAPPPEFTGHVSYTDTMGPWSQSGTLVTPAGTLIFTPAHAQMLGITVGPAPRWHFGDHPQQAGTS